MTPQEFITWAEGYYGAYPEGQMNDVFNYLKSWEPLYIEALKRVTILNHSSQFKTPPDIAVMNKLYPQASAEQDKIQRNNGPRPLPDMNETDAQKAARLHADMEYCNVTMQTPGWFAKVLQYRIDRGDYRDSKAATKPGGVIKSTKDVGNPKPLTSWEDLGNYAKV